MQISLVNLSWCSPHLTLYFKVKVMHIFLYKIKKYHHLKFRILIYLCLHSTDHFAKWHNFPFCTALKSFHKLNLELPSILYKKLCLTNVLEFNSFNYKICKGWLEKGDKRDWNHDDYHSYVNLKLKLKQF